MSGTYNFHKQYNYDRISKNIYDSVIIIQKRKKTIPNYKKNLQYYLQRREEVFAYKLYTEYSQQQKEELDINKLFNFT